MFRAVCVLALAAGALIVPLGVGHASPPGCTQAALSIDIDGIAFPVRNGQQIMVTPKVGNDHVPGACDISDATITIQFPKADGSDGGRLVTVATDVDLPANEPQVTYSPVAHTAKFNDGVFRGSSPSRSLGRSISSLPLEISPASLARSGRP